MIRFGNYVVKDINVTGLESLTEKEQHTLYELNQSAIVCRDLRFLQTSIYSLPVKEVLESIALGLQRDNANIDAITETLNNVWFSGGIYYEGTGTRIQLDLTQADFEALARQYHNNASDVTLAITGLFNSGVPESICTNDPREEYGFRTHEETITSSERVDFMKNIYLPKMKAVNPIVDWGVNAFLLRNKTTNEIEVEYFSIHSTAFDGKLAAILTKAVEHLQSALGYCDDNPELSENISSLITFYQTGHPVDFYNHCIAWTNDNNSSIFFVHGFIEKYEDPMKLMGYFEAMIGFNEPEKTAQIHTIISMAQEIEDSLPIDPKFKRTEAKGGSGQSVVITAFSGGCAPTMPLGNLLSNNDYIRENIGSRTSVFVNIMEQRDSFTPELAQRFIHPDYAERAAKDFLKGFYVIVNLHECAGHASGVLGNGVDPQALGEVLDIIEECRADLVAYYTFGNVELLSKIEPNVDDYPAFIEAIYAEYLTQGSFMQLYRMPPDTKELTATHFRNRQLNNSWVLEKGLNDGFLRLEDNELGRPVIKMLDVSKVHAAYGELLGIIQTIKSTGDKKAAQALISQYATHIDPAKHLDAQRRVADIDQPAFTGFTHALLTPTTSEDGHYKVEPNRSFFDDQISLSKKGKVY
jgi:dipeptidyl-peptidase-3